MTRYRLIARIADVLRRSGVDDADRLIEQLEYRLPQYEVADPDACNRVSNVGVTCAREAGHDGYCQSNDGYRWTTIPTRSSE